MEEGVVYWTYFKRVPAGQNRPAKPNGIRKWNKEQDLCWKGGECAGSIQPACWISCWIGVTFDRVIGVSQGNRNPRLQLSFRTRAEHRYYKNTARTLTLL